MTSPDQRTDPVPIGADALCEHLRHLLANLYNPAHSIPDAMLQVLRPVAGADAAGVRQYIIGQIQALRPGPNVPQTARIRRLYQVLHLRYVEEWTQQRVAEELGITVRHLAREQTRAIAFLADRLLRAAGADEPDADARSALQESLASLAQAAGPASADLGSAVRRTCQLVGVVADGHHAVVTVLPAEPGIMVAVLPSVLVQILVRALTQLVTHAQGGEIVVEALSSATQGLCRMQASPYTGPEPTPADLSSDLVHSQRGELALTLSEQQLEIEIAFPLVPKKTVLVIDDNPDLIHYYQQCVANAPYQIYGVTQGDQAVPRAVALRPSVIVLDLMLPDKDGWDILEELEAQPNLEGVPIIIASVVGEQELAMALGATLCLKKPVRRAEFLAALDAVTAASRV